MYFKAALLLLFTLGGLSAQAAEPGVPRALFTYSVVDREPGPAIEVMGLDHDMVTFFTEIVGMNGRQIVHEWLYEDQPQFRMRFDIGGDSWRVYSSKSIPPSAQGVWRVRVIDEQGRRLHESTLKVPGADEL